MKTTCLLSLPFVFSTAIFARAEIPDTAVSNLTFTHRTNLIDIDQNQTFETLSMADGFSRLPVSAYKEAKVYFITSDSGHVFGGTGSKGGGIGSSGAGFEDTSKQKCEDLGYKLTSCTSGSPIDICPYNSSYFKSCCDASYKHNSSTVCMSPQTLSTDSCGGKYKCECPPSTFSFTTCGDFMITGESCEDDSGAHYVCTCPTGINVAKEDCKTFYAAPCSDVCKEAYSDTCHRYEGKGVKAPYDCEEYFEGCDSICKTAYKDNCRNRDDMPHPFDCKTPWADCPEKCQEAYTDNCHKYSDVATPYGCKTPYDDCQAKCKEAWPDNCHKYPDALDSCPPGNSNCTRYSDCSSKVKSFTCKSGLTKSDNACLLPYTVLYGNGDTSRDFAMLSKQTPIGIVFDATNHLAMAMKNVEESGKASPNKTVMTWANVEKGYDIPNLENCDDVETIESCQVDGRANTDKILACGADCEGTPAATACNLYEPAGCTKPFCKKGKWFLPSIRDLKKFTNLYGVLIGSYGIEKIGGYPLSGNYFWSSNENSGRVAWGANVAYDVHWEARTSGKTVGYWYLVRPVVNYSDTSND